MAQLVWYVNGSSLIMVGRRQFVRTGSSTSFLARILFGVPQGSVLGPILSLLYTADMCCLLRAMVSALICMQMTPKSMGSVVRLQAPLKLRPYGAI